MAGLDRAFQAARGLAPVPVPTRGPSGRVALVVTLVVLSAVVGIALLGQTDDGESGSELALGGATSSATSVPTASPTAPPTPMSVAQSLPEAPLTPSTPPPRISASLGQVRACPPGSTPDRPGPVDQARPTDVSGMAFDRKAGRLMVLSGTVTGSVETWTFDVCRNIWTRMNPDREPPPGTGDLVYDVDSDITITLDGDGWVWAYDVVANTWVVKGAGPAAFAGRPRLIYDAVSGFVVVVANDGTSDDQELWGYDVETDTWAPIRQANRLAAQPRNKDVAYDASVDRLVAYAVAPIAAEARMWLFDLRTGVWAGTDAVAPPFGHGWGIGPAIAYDEAAERVVMLGQGHAAAYDAGTDRWETLYEALSDDGPGACGSRTECRQLPKLVYDPVNERLITFGGRSWTSCRWTAPDDMWAYDMATRTWTLIVPPTPVPPPLRDLAASGPSSSTEPDRSPWTRAAKVTLHGGPFFTRVPGVADGGPWSSTPHAAAASVADGLFLPECQGWTEGTVWWEETTSDPASRAWIEIDLGATFVLDAVVVQADVNDEYRLSSRNPKTGEWTTLWDVPLGEAGGMATRPELGDASVRWPLASPVVTDALRFEATSGDAQYSVSEVAVFGQPAH